MSNYFSRCCAGRALPALVLALLALVVPAASADDRDLLRESSASPYVFIILDTSGSMHWSTTCTAANAATDLDPTDGGCTSECKLGSLCAKLCPATACVDLVGGVCNRTANVCVQPICEAGDCHVSLNGDDPSSKLFQAKEALHEVLRNTTGVNFGFATYNQNELRAVGKHWLYQMKAGEHPAHLLTGQHFPPDGSIQVFGRTHTCNSGGDVTGFQADAPASLDDPWAMERVLRCAQLGQAGTTNAGGSRLIFLIDPSDGLRYRLQWRSIGGETLGAAELTARARLERCTNADCSTRVFIEDADITYELVSDFSSWDNNARRLPPQSGFFSQGSRSDNFADDTCQGWDPNDDEDEDDFEDINLRFATTSHPNFSPLLDTGDLIPLDWTDNHVDEILDRLAPNRLLGETTPDFRVARYLEDRLNSDNILELRDDAARPLMGFGATPLGNSMANFRDFYDDFKAVAEDEDGDFACRKKYVLFLTDGDDTCGVNDPCTVAKQIFDDDNVRTFVIGYGVSDLEDNPNNKLECMAREGDTGVPLLPQNKDALVNVLTDLLGDISEEARAFASAAVPSVQAEASDKIFLSTFTPLNGTGYWDGHLDAFLKPLPRTLDGRPNRNKRCVNQPADEQSACLAWDAGEALLLQAPTAAQVAASDFRIGNAVDQRRVFYPHAPNLATNAIPNARSLFLPPGDANSRRELWDAMGINDGVADLALSSSTPGSESLNIVRQTLTQKQATIDNPDGTTTEITYILGDIFHSNPTLVDRPDDFNEFAVNRNAGTSDADGQTCTNASTGYRCFARKHQYRRKMLGVGANDGQVHFFDAGVWDQTEEEFTDGTGSELFAMIPRMAMPIVAELEEGGSQIFSVDGSLRAVNVFIDPKHSVTGPTPADRQWRTIAIGGMREAGGVQAGGIIELDNAKPLTPGYFALDITQPDRLDSENKPSPVATVPTCLSNYNQSDCGPVEFGAELWEFTDSIDGSPAEWGVALDEDNNGHHDLGDTWSTPVIGRIRILVGSAEEQRWVAIFGGGFDPRNRSTPRRGTWLYMVDVETGETLYKRPLEGAAPSTPAVVDFNSDGILDAVYIGTTAGFMYKVDLRTPQSLATVDVNDLSDIEHSVQRIAHADWEPFKIFDTLADGVRRPIFFPPTVLLVAEAGKFALAFGTGDREDMWNLNDLENRFYIIADEGFVRTDLSLPRTESSYTVFAYDSGANPTENYLLRPPTGTSRGYIITLEPGERVVAAPFSISGLTVFPTFQPEILNIEEVNCAHTGDSRVFAILTTNGDPVLPDEGSGETRSFTVNQALVTPPYVDQGASGNPGGSTPLPPADVAWREAIMDKLKQFFPPRTRFANYTIEVNFLRSDTGVVRSVPVPIGVVSKNWKQF